MRSLFTVTRETKLAGAIGGMLSRPAAAVAIAGSLSVLTLAASLYLFMFAGRDLLPPPPIAGLPAARILEPVPMNPAPAIIPGFEVPIAPIAPVLLAEGIPSGQAAIVQSDSGTAGIVAGVSVEPSRDDDDEDRDDDDHSGSRSEEPKKSEKSKSEKSESSSGERSKVSRQDD